MRQRHFIKMDSYMDNLINLILVVISHWTTVIDERQLNLDKRNLG